MKGFGTSVYHSTNTLQNSITSWTIPKADRFKEIYKKPQNGSLYNPISLTEGEARCTTQGYGKRTEIISLQGKCSPPPNRYKLKTDIENNLKAKKGYSITFKRKEIVYI